MWSLVVHLVSQDLSVAGKRAGLAGERSGLFMEQIRIVREMREKHGPNYPRFMVWENVPGAFSAKASECANGKRRKTGGYSFLWA